MGKYPQNRFRRLVLVGSCEQSRQPATASSRWAGVPPAQPTRAQLKALRMAVMPTFSRGIWIEALSAMSRFIRTRLGGQPAQPRGAVVLSFRRSALLRPWRQPAAESNYGSKKGNGRVHWTGDQTTQEGGRS
jgi:hypothetical protein